MATQSISLSDIESKLGLISAGGALHWSNNPEGQYIAVADLIMVKEGDEYKSQKDFNDSLLELISSKNSGFAGSITITGSNGNYTLPAQPSVLNNLFLIADIADQTASDVTIGGKVIKQGAILIATKDAPQSVEDYKIINLAQGSLGGSNVGSINTAVYSKDGSLVQGLTAEPIFYETSSKELKNKEQYTYLAISKAAAEPFISTHATVDNDGITTTNGIISMEGASNPVRDQLINRLGIPSDKIKNSYEFSELTIKHEGLDEPTTYVKVKIVVDDLELYFLKNALRGTYENTDRIISNIDPIAKTGIDNPLEYGVYKPVVATSSGLMYAYVPVSPMDDAKIKTICQ